MSSPSRLSLWTCQSLHLQEATFQVPWKSCKVRLKISCTRMHIIRRSDVPHRQPPGTTSWLFSLGQPVETRVSDGVCSLSWATVPYSESPGQAHLVLHSQAAVGAHTKARAVLRWDDPLDRRKGSWQSKRNLETLIPLQNMITRGLVVDKGNSAQSTYQLSNVCTITQKYVALYGKGHQWLVGIDVDAGPDGRNSPTFVKQNFDAQEAAALYQNAHLHTMEDLGDNGLYPNVISQLALRILTYEYPLEAILAIYYLSATGHLPAKFPHDQWNEAVRWHGDTKLAATVQNEAELADAKIILSKLEKVVVEAESRHGVVVWSSTQNCPTTIPADAYPLQLIVLPGEEIQRHLPETLHVEATGLGGRDLLYPIPWDISIRSDKEDQSIYGLAPMEETVDIPRMFGGTETVQVTALGRSQAAHEFLVLHYFGLDSAKHWDALLLDVLPAFRFPGASARRATALEMFGASHIAPSHRRMPHVLWTDSMNLVWNLLMGGRMGRYTGSPDTLVFGQRIDLRGFSAGSFAGLSTLHLLWQMPNVVTNGKLGAIACPPQLIVTPPTDHTLHLLHYEADQLCVWKPGRHQLNQLQIRYTYVSIEGPAYKEHFGSKEHNYSHWLSLNHTAGWWDLARFLFMNPEAASSAKRDATPLRLLSWLSFRLEPAVEKLVEATMLYLSTVEEVKDSELLELGRKHLEVDTPFASAEALRDHLIELISVRNLRHRPEALFALFRQFLQRLSLPRICHFLDLVLPPHPSFHTVGPRHWGQHQHLPSSVQLGCTVAYIPGGSHRRNQWWLAWCVRLCCGSLVRYQALFGWLGLSPIQWHRPTYQISLPMRVAAAGIQCA